MSENLVIRALPTKPESETDLFRVNTLTRARMSGDLRVAGGGPGRQGVVCWSFVLSYE